jgi:hypothetical protein
LIIIAVLQAPRACYTEIIGGEFMSQQILEGAWKEIAEHAGELSGKRVKLIVLGESRRLPVNNAAEKSQPAAPTKDTEGLFQELANQWRRETAHLSLAIKKVTHPAYQRIIGLGLDAVPLILRELQRRSGHWFWALKAITGEDPAQPEDTARSSAGRLSSRAQNESSLPPRWLFHSNRLGNDSRSL